MDIARPTLDHLRIFVEVADRGSFNGAAKSLGRAISVVSYAIANLEAQLGVTLFDREGSRRPVLTEQGTALLAEARRVADDVDGLVARVRGLRQGLEAELSIAVDVMFPCDELAPLLREFQFAHPTVPLRLHVDALGAVAANVLDGKATFAIAGPDIVDHPAMARRSLGAVKLVPVASPDHALARMARIEPGASRKHLQLVLTDRSNMTDGKDFSVFAARTWRLGDLGAKHALLRQGIGWGYMPLHMIRDDLRSGALLQLPIPENQETDYRLHALWRQDSPPGPAARWLLEQAHKLIDPDGAVAIGTLDPISR